MIKIDEVYRNSQLLELIVILLNEKKFVEVVMLGEVIIGDKHPSILKSFEVITNMCEDVNVINMRQRIKLKLEELREAY